MNQPDPIRATDAGAQIRAQRAIDERLIAAIFGENAAAFIEATLSPVDDGPLTRIVKRHQRRGMTNT